MKLAAFRLCFIIFFCLSSILFFSPVFIPFPLLFLTYYAFFLGTVLLVIFSNRHSGKNEFSGPILLLIIAILISGLSATYSWEQGMLDSFKALIYYLSYILFFLLIIWKTPVQDIEKIISILGTIYFVIFTITFLLYPTQIFGGEQVDSIERGFQRINLTGTGFLFLFSFYSIKKYLQERQFLWLLIFIISLIYIVMLLSRTLMMVSFVLLTLYILHLSSLLKKLLAIFVISCFVYLVSQMNFFQLMAKETKEQSQNKEDDIRVLSANYYLNDFSPNTFSLIFGNGEGTNESIYGQNMDYIKNKLGYYQSDIGYIGFYSKFGVLAILAYLIFIYKTIKTSVPDDYLYAKYFLFFIFIISIIIDAPFNPGFISSIIIAAYVLNSKDLKRPENKSAVKPGLHYLQSTSSFPNKHFIKLK